MDIKLLPDWELGYLAGFVDADGSIGIVSVAKHKQYVAQISVTNCNKDIVDLFAKYFGGHIRQRVWKNPKWKPCYEWKLTADQACDVIALLFAFLKLKQKQADLVLSLGQIKHIHNAVTKRWHPELKIESDRRCAELKEQCAILNKRGI